MTDLAEFVSDYLAIGPEARLASNREIAAAFLDQHLPEGADFDAEVEKLAPQIAYYTERDQ